MTAVIVLGPAFVALVLGGIAGTVIGVRAYPTDAARDEALSHATNAITWLCLISMLSAYAFMAPQVSYRWFDAFCLLVPIYSIFWLIKIAYRLAYLPHRDWAPRPDEIRPASAPTPGWPSY
jgi:hypothetical protein